jgi:putative tricarboxylic transport membrane protein
MPQRNGFPFRRSRKRLRYVQAPSRFAFARLSMRFHDILSGAFLLVFGAVIAFYARTFPATPGQNIGPGLFPMLIGAGLAVSGLLLVWTGWRERAPGARWAELEDWLRRPRMALNAALVVGALVFYALAVDTLGFFLTGFLLLGTLFMAFGVRRRWIAPIAAAATLGIHFAFYTLLRVPLPWGWFEGIAW